jgi:hypothetical protein
MRIFVPFTKLHLATILAVPDATFVPMTDQMAYSRYFMERWREAETFINVEHDVSPTRETLEMMWRCSEPWCFCTYREDRPDDRTPYFGCVKFDEDFIRAHPDIWEEHAWGNLDTFMCGRTKAKPHWHGVARHWHYGAYPKWASLS